jgi:hemolysin activation/secretion protein
MCLNSSLFAISKSDIKRIEAQNRNILLDNKSRNFFEENEKEMPYQSQKIEPYKVIRNTNTLNSHCYEVHNIQFLDNQQFSSKQLISEVKKYINQCLTTTDIQNVLNNINNYYMQRGYITSRAYLKNQDLSKGILQIHLLEGRIDEIILNDEMNASELTTAFPNVKDNILNLRDIEMGLDQINRLSRNNAKLKLQASTKQGYSNVNIENNEGKAIFSTFSIASNGLESTGRGIGSANFYLENLFGFNTQITLGYNGSLRPTNEKKSRGYSVGVNIPYGYFLFSAIYREFLYRSTIYGENGNYISSGISNNHNYQGDYTFYRDADSAIKTSLGLSWQQNLNFIANELIKTSSSKTTTGKISLNGFYKQEGTTFSFDVSMHHGLSLFDPVINSSNSNKKYNFLKYTTYLSANGNTSFLDTPLQYNSTLSGQYSNDRLHNQELFSMGGFYTVRGFNYMGYFGEIGAYLHNDLTYNTSIQLLGEKIKFSPYFGLDGGVIEYDPSIFKHMIGTGFGIRSSLLGLNLSLDFAAPLYAYDPIAEKEYVSSFSISFQY